MANMPGYAGQILEIDLSSETSTAIPLDPKLARDYVGGRALGLRLLWDEYGGNWGAADPLGPDSALFLMCGPTNGYVPGKTLAVFKSPMSGGAMGSAMSGDWTAMIRCAGFDGVKITGKARKPVWLYIENGNVQFRDATGIWGMDTRETHKALMDATDPKLPMLYIGPAGENQVKFASIMTNWFKACGRGGSGAVLGSKNLKGMVIKGTGPVPQVADLESLLALMATLQKDVPLQAASFHMFGTTPSIFTNTYESSSGPVRNWQSEYSNLPGLSVTNYATNDWERRYWADYGCTLACSKIGRTLSGPNAGHVFELPDYEGGAYFGPNFEVGDADAVAYGADLADTWGLDVISTGNVLAWATELHERGILSTSDLDGLDPKWGSLDVINQLVAKVAQRDGIGDTLAEGTYAAANKIGQDSLQYAVQVKAIELGAHGVRSGQDYTNGLLSYAICTQGGDHTSIAYATSEMWYLEDTWPICGFWGMGVSADQKLQLLNDTTGFGVTADELNNAMMLRWLSLQRATQLLAGWTRADDHNPPRFYEPLPDGPYAGKSVDQTQEQQQIDEAFAARGWDSQGIPTSDTLQKLGLSDIDPSLAPLRQAALGDARRSAL
jgi:aldehyde:ferredoxin oxidoreductase